MLHIQSILGSASLISFFIIFIIYVSRREDYYIGLILFFGFFIRLLFSFLQEFYQILPYVWDEAVFHHMSVGYFDYLTGESIMPYDSSRINSVSSYGTFLGSLYYIFGQHPFIGRLIGSILGTTVVYIAYKISYKIGVEKKYIYLSSLIICFTPSYIIFSGLIMRDMLFWVLTYLFIYFCYFIFNNFNLKYLLFSFLVTIPLVLLRKQYAPLYMIYYFIIFMLFLKNKIYFFKSININFLKYIFLISLITIGIYGSYVFLLYELSTWNNSEIVEYFASQMEYRARGGTSYLDGLEYNSFFDIFKYAPLRFIYFVYGPFLWTSNNLFTILASLENLLIWLFTIMFIFNIKYVSYLKDYKKKNFLIFIFSFIFISLSANALIDSNFGTAIRHKMIYIPIFYTLVFFLLSLKLSKNGSQSN